MDKGQCFGAESCPEEMGRRLALCLGYFRSSNNVPGDQDMLPLLHDFVDATKDMQHRDTPSGGYRTGGLGEGPHRIYMGQDAADTSRSQVRSRPKTIHR